MGRMYNGQVTAVAIAEARDLFELLAPADAVLVVHSWAVFQTTDLGDAQEEIVRLETVRGVGAVTSGSGGSSVTTQPVSDGDAATGATLEANNTTRMAAGSGSLDTLEQYGWNVRIPMQVIYTPETRPVVSPSNRWTLALPAAPADSITLSAMITFEEIGG
jgi:hypothetical protein